MVKPLVFKGDKPKKRKRAHKADADNEDGAPASKQLVTANEAPPDDDENWVSADSISDISGPVMFVLPTEPPTSMSVDQLGKVFSQKIENLVEGLPGSAQPHDVRQVWIATRVVGSESDFIFKGHHGRYLGCDKFGICFASREAISPEETFKLHAVEGQAGLFDIQTGKSTYICVDADKSPAEVRGDAEETGETTHLRIRMQARFKPKHKVEKAEKVRSKITRKELEDEVGRRLDEEEVKMLKKARREGNYHEAMLDVKVKGKHDKFA
jgi:protein FRG1